MEDEGFYSRERWNNWMERLREEEFDPEDEESADIFFKLQNDITIACANAVDAYDEGHVDEDEFMEELGRMQEILMSEENLGDTKGMMLEGVQTSLMAVLESCGKYVANGAPSDGTVSEYVEEGVRAEREDDMDRALALVAEAGALILDGEEFEADSFDDLEYGFVSEWVNGLDSLAEAVREPEMIEEEEEDE
jgi:hypothetical protein